jgi:hypothetical protein
VAWKDAGRLEFTVDPVGAVTTGGVTDPVAGPAA